MSYIDETPPVGSVLRAQRMFTTGDGDFTVDRAVEENEICVVIDLIETNDIQDRKRWTLVLLFPRGIMKWGDEWDPWKRYFVVA